METFKAGTRLQSDTGAQAIVVKPPSEGGLAFRLSGSVMLGKRYSCQACGAEMLITKGGEAELVCHGSVMGVVKPKALPSSD